MEGPNRPQRADRYTGRSGAEATCHPHVGYPGLLEGPRLHAEARPAIERRRGQLGGEARLRAAALAGSLERDVEHARGDPAPAPVALYGDAPDLRLRPHDQQPQRAHGTVTGELAGEQVLGLIVEAVALERARRALFPAEDTFSEPQARLRSSGVRTHSVARCTTSGRAPRSVMAPGGAMVAQDSVHGSELPAVAVHVEGQKQ